MIENTREHNGEEELQTVNEHKVIRSDITHFKIYKSTFQIQREKDPFRSEKYKHH
jgi:hypothetical protein